MTRRSARTTALAYRSTSIAALAVVASGTSGGEARAAGLATSDESALSATMQCDPALGGGRVKCVVEARAEKAAIAWADVALVHVPDFVVGLKGRLGPADATARLPAIERWAFGLASKRSGRGEVKARVRAVLCPKAAPDRTTARCVPLAIEVTAEVLVE